MIGGHHPCLSRQAPSCTAQATQARTQAARWQDVAVPPWIGFRYPCLSPSGATPEGASVTHGQTEPRQTEAAVEEAVRGVLGHFDAVPEWGGWMPVAGMSLERAGRGAVAVSVRRRYRGGGHGLRGAVVASMESLSPAAWSAVAPPRHTPASWPRTARPNRHHRLGCRLHVPPPPTRLRARCLHCALP